MDRIEELEKEISYCEAAILDIEHWLEFYDFDDDEAAQMSKMIKEYRVKRRGFKDNLMVLSPVYDFTLKKEHETALRQISHLVGEIRKKVTCVNGERKYSPRVLFEIFGQEPPKSAVELAFKKARGE